MANTITILRMIIAFIAICLLFYQTPASYITAFLLTIIAIWFDGLDGFVARLFNETSKFGAVLDILGDRVVENIYWIVFAVLGWINILFPLICVTRAFVTDSLRSVALAQGYTAFGAKSMQSSKWGQLICSSKITRISYAVAKVAAFILLIVANTPGIEIFEHYETINTVAIVLAWIAIIFCVVRGIPVVLESGKLFENAKNGKA